MSNESDEMMVPMAFHCNLWNAYIDAAFTPACSILSTSPEMKECWQWLADFTAGTNYNDQGVNNLELPVKIASHIIASCILFGLNNATKDLAPWGEIAKTLNEDLYKIVGIETMQILADKDLRHKGFPFLGNDYGQNVGDN